MRLGFYSFGRGDRQAEEHLQSVVRGIAAARERQRVAHLGDDLILAHDP